MGCRVSPSQIGYTQGDVISVTEDPNAPRVKVLLRRATRVRASCVLHYPAGSSCASLFNEAGIPAVSVQVLGGNRTDIRNRSPRFKAYGK